MLTAAAAGATAWSGALGGTLAAKIAKDGPVPALTGVVPSKGTLDVGVMPAATGILPAQSTPKDVAAVQRQLRVLQWVIPSLMGVVMALSAQQGEQQAADAASAATQSKVGLRRVLRRTA